MTPGLYHRGQVDKVPDQTSSKTLSFGTVTDSEIGVDWLSLTFPSSCFQNVYNALLEQSGGEVPKDGRGRQGWQQGHYFPNGSVLHTGGKDDRSWLVLSGGPCRLLGQRRLRDFGKIAGVGARCPRLDIRLDFFGSGLSIVDRALESCEAGHLRILRRFKSYPIKSDTLELLGNGIGLGAEPRYLRIYDKGLESQTRAPGEWVRVEAELKDWCAHEAFVALFTAETMAQFSERLLARLLAVVDFRVGDRSIHLGRLHRPQWWQDLIGDAHLVRPAAPVQDASLERWFDAARVQYGATITEAARLADVSVEFAASRIFEDCRVNRGTQDNPILGPLSAWLRSQVASDSSCSGQ